MTKPRIGIIGEGFVGRSMCRLFPPPRSLNTWRTLSTPSRSPSATSSSTSRAHGVDYNELREVWLADPRISRDRTFVYPDNRGFSGKCLPKDTSAILRSSAERGFAPPLLKAVMDINGRHRADDPTYAPYRRKGKRHGRS